MHTYSQATGEWRHNGSLLGIGYSGFGEGLNNGELQGVVDVGPVPRGIYSVGSPEDLAGGPHGPFVLRLTPNVPTSSQISATGRSPFSFLVHGGKTGELDPHEGTASRGCVVLERSIRVAIAALVSAGDNHLQVQF